MKEYPARVVDELKNIAEAIGEDPSPAVITEHIFRNGLLGMFDLTRDPDPVYNDNWLALAGNYQRPIDVVDDNTGERLFQVPPIVGDLKLVESPSEAESFYSIIVESKRKNKIIPGSGDRLLTEKLLPKIEANNHSARMVAFLRMIQKRYNMPYPDYCKVLFDDNSTQVNAEKPKPLAYD